MGSTTQRLAIIRELIRKVRIGRADEGTNIMACYFFMFVVQRRDGCISAVYKNYLSLSGTRYWVLKAPWVISKNIRYDEKWCAAYVICLPTSSSISGNSSFSILALNIPRTRASRLFNMQLCYIVLAVFIIFADALKLPNSSILNYRSNVSIINKSNFQADV